MNNRPESLWRATHQLRRFAPLARDTETDVAVIGGGISGLTAAALLARAGRRVILLERDHIGSGESGNTTSHLTEAVDARYRALVRDFGGDTARLVAQSSRDAIAFMASIAGASKVDCGFERVPGYLYSENGSDLEQLASELDAARRAGCAVQWVDRVPLPFRTAGGVQWDDQAQVHATAYAAALLDVALASGAQVHDTTRVVGVHDGHPSRVETDHGRVDAAHVFVAANVPVNNRVLLHTKIAAYRSYAIAAEINPPIQAALFWDTDHPYHYTRTHAVDGRMYLIVGGEDHRTGLKTDTDACYDRLRAYAQARFGSAGWRYHWSGQIIEPVDGLPFIGRNAAEQHVYVATGYSGNGMTFGTLAGMIVSDLILGVPNPYADVYDATRVKPLAAAVEYVKENAVFPVRLVTDRLTSINADEQSIQSLHRGEGAIFTSDEGKIAVCRDSTGIVHAVSAVCTHLGCDVAWNHAEQTWDCPCHGSRFTPEGKVLNGPAVSDLRPVPVKAVAH